MCLNPLNERRSIKMRLRNILIVVNDIEKSKQFYHDLFGLDVLLDQGGQCDHVRRSCVAGCIFVETISEPRHYSKEQFLWTVLWRVKYRGISWETKGALTVYPICEWDYDTQLGSESSSFLWSGWKLNWSRDTNVTQVKWEQEGLYGDSWFRFYR